MNDVQNQCAKAIRQKQSEIDRLEQEIRDVAKTHIPDFHFLDYQVSTFWACDKSPIGMCVLERSEFQGRMVLGNCRYCGDPNERK
jgi:hypothetical protein